MATWMRLVWLSGCLAAAASPAQMQPPKELAPWESWVLDGQEYLRCPFFANTSGSAVNERPCAWPGRLNIEVGAGGGKFTQQWTVYADSWLALPGGLEHWPSAVTLNGMLVPVVTRESTPSVRVGAGTHTVQGVFGWQKRPESLAIPAQTGLLSLTIDDHKVAQPERDEGAVWLGKQHEADATRQLNVQVYRLLADGIPLILQTRVLLQVAGDVREESLPSLLPAGFEPMALESELPARIEADGHARVQVRPGNWTLSLTARAAAIPAVVKVPAATGEWPKQEVWSYRADERLRVAGLSGGESIDAAQANVPPEWRQYPGYRVAAGTELRLEERGRGASLQESNHLTLNRRLYLDFSHQGFTAVDAINGQLRSGWRVDMRAPYRLMRASSGANNLLITQVGDGALTGVELRAPSLALESEARIGVGGGVLPASGWNQRFDRVTGEINLPPGHRLLAVLGADSAPQTWLERWGLMDVFLLLLASVIAYRLFGLPYALVTFLALALLHQEEGALVWWILSVLLANVLLRAVPAGRVHRALSLARYALLGALLITVVPLAIMQLRFALYPQLADPEAQVVQEVHSISAPPPKLEEVAAQTAGKPSYAPAPEAREVQEVVVTARTQTTNVENPYSLSSLVRDRYAPGTVLQAGPGIPQWRYASYEYAWNGPVDPEQTVRFVVASPWLMALWRVSGVAILLVLLTHLLRGSVDLDRAWRRLTTRGAASAVLLTAAVAASLIATPSRAQSTPDPQLLELLKQRLTRPPACVPQCAEYMSARIEATAARVEVTLQAGALTALAVPLPSLGERWDWQDISVDGAAVGGVWRDADGQLWLPLKSGAHTVKVAAPTPHTDSFQILFPNVPHGVAAHSEGWQVSGINAGRMLANTVEFLRTRGVGPEEPSQGSAQFAPYVRVHREFLLDLDWSVLTTVERLAPDKGGFTLEIPLLAGERLLSNGVDTKEGTRVLASFDSTAREYRWRSALPNTSTLTLTARAEQPWSEVWIFKVSPIWRVAFAGVPATLPELHGQDDWSYEYFPRPGEQLTLTISRPNAVPGSTLAIDRLDLDYRVGQRSSTVGLNFEYRSTRGGLQTIVLPLASRLQSVHIDNQSVPIHADRQELPLAVLPGAHQVSIEWETPERASVSGHFSPVDLQAPSSNVSVTLHLPQSRWILFAGGRGVGPAILYWGELAVFVAFALLLGNLKATPLRRREWLLLGLGLSTFSWMALLLFAAWMFALRWRETHAVDELSAGQFKLLQITLMLLSLAALIGIVAAIPFGLLANPDMRIEGFGQSAYQLRWFNDVAAGAPPTPWVLSVSLWWYKAAMLLWALWLAFALARWLPMAWRALSMRGFWPTAPQARATS